MSITYTKKDVAKKKLLRNSAKKYSRLKKSSMAFSPFFVK